MKSLTFRVKRIISANKEWLYEWISSETRIMKPMYCELPITHMDIVLCPPLRWNHGSDVHDGNVACRASVPVVDMLGHGLLHLPSATSYAMSPYVTRKINVSSAGVDTPSSSGSPS